MLRSGSKLAGIVAAGVLVVSAVVYAAGAGAEAAASSPDKTVITSESLVFDYGRSTGVFEKNVFIDDPRVKMECQKLYVFFDSTNQVDSIVATGGVKIWQGNKRGVCEKAVYTEKTGAIVMTGKPKLQRGNDLVQGKEITIYVNSEKLICKPGRLVIFPGELKKPQRNSRKR
jgi:lipopolysaccharide transport protein LptA